MVNVLRNTRTNTQTIYLETFKIITETIILIVVFWIPLCSLVGGSNVSEGIYRLHLQGENKNMGW